MYLECIGECGCAVNDKRYRISRYTISRCAQLNFIAEMRPLVTSRNCGRAVGQTHSEILRNWAQLLREQYGVYSCTSVTLDSGNLVVNFPRQLDSWRLIWIWTRLKLQRNYFDLMHYVYFSHISRLLHLKLAALVVCYARSVCGCLMN